MKKDTAVAIFIGFIIGGLAALGVIYLPNFLSGVFRTNSEVTLLTPTPSVSISAAAPLLNITEPEDNSLIFTDKTTIKGKIQPLSAKLIIVDTNNESVIISTNDVGEFSEEVSLDEGINPFSVSVYDDNGNRETKTVTLFYTAEKL